MKSLVLKQLIFCDIVQYVTTWVGHVVEISRDCLNSLGMFKAIYLFDVEAMTNTDTKLRNISNDLAAPPIFAVTNV